MLAQLRVHTQDILVSLATGDNEDLTEPYRLSATDEWTELIIRLRSNRAQSLRLKLDNSYSMIRSKHIQIRFESVGPVAYTAAWEGCLEMAQSITWNHASKAGSERCAEYMASLHHQEETEVILQRNQDGGASDGEQSR